MTRRRTIATAAILVGALGLTACGTNRNEAGGTGGGSSCDTSKGTLVIGMVAPLSGSLSALGLGMRNSTKLAVDQANQKCTVKGYKLAFQPEDDQATAQIGGQAATKLASDPTVVGVVGTLNSSVAQTVA
ncbi:MAG: branched-chain amino acid transport system substrate-binding protein, partial [Pseudonocardiales bacterium]|nr:branched-chain amino acid transport system substrate-binding protein [Pseudonocardiales bacterium]